MTGRTRNPQAGPDVARAKLWADTRIAVVDVETCAGEDGAHIVGVGIVTCRKATVTGSWSSLVNPGVPIDEHSSRIHGITDAHVADEPSFAQLAPTVTGLLTPTDGERLVLAGHNVGFDVARLHLELSRVDLELADLPLPATMKLPATLGVTTRGRKLPAVLDALGLVNPTHHDAASDAAATAQAIVALLEHAAHAGEDDLDALLRRTARRQTRTSSISPATTSTGARRRDDPDDGEPLPDDHTVSHAELLPAKPTKKTLNAWRDALADCVALRCPYLPDRIDTAEAPGRLLLTELETALDTALTAGDAAGAATVLDAAGGLYRELDGRKPALAWYDRWAPRIAAVGRCTGEDDRCPACREGRPCPADVWHHDLAPVALGRPDLAKTFLPPTGERAGTGVFATWHRDGRARLADYTAWLSWNYWRGADQPSRADTVARFAWEGGGRDPRLVNVYAGLLAASGTPDALDMAIEVCDQALADRHGDSDDGWRQVAIRRGQLAGRQARLTARAIGTDADGNPIHARRHHPQAPRRRRPHRFKLG